MKLNYEFIQYLRSTETIWITKVLCLPRGLQGLKVLLKCMKLNYKRTFRGKIKIIVQCTRGLQVQQGSTSWAIRHSLQWVGTWFGMSLTQPTIYAILVRQSQMIHPLMMTHIAHWLAHTIQSTHNIHQYKRNTTYSCYSQIQMFW